MYRWQRKRAFEKAIEIFGSKYKAIMWMRRPTIIFNNKAPNNSKYKYVIAELHRIDHGIFS